MIDGLHRSAETPVELLLADADDRLRAVFACAMIDMLDVVSVIEATNGADAVRIGLQRRPQLALLDLKMPRLNGFEAAVTLRELAPTMRVALHTAGPCLPYERAGQLGLPLFDKLEFERTLGWLDSVVHESRRSLADELPRRDLECRSCGYGIASARAPERCPMCQNDGAWIDPPRTRLRERAATFLQEPTGSSVRSRRNPSLTKQGGGANGIHNRSTA
jgi:hypothetical protein